MIQLICGDEPYLVMRKKQNIVSSVSMPELNLCRSCMVTEEEVNFATTTSWDGSGKILLLEVKTLAELDNQHFRSLWENRPETCDIYVFAEKIEKNRKEYKMFQAAKAIGTFKKLDEMRFPAFVKKYLAEAGKKMDGASFGTFCKQINYYDNSEVTLFDVVNALETLVCVAEEEYISSSLVEQYVVSHEVDNCFSLAGYIKKKDIEGACKEIELMKEKNNFAPIQLISILLREVRIAYKSKLYPEEMKKSVWKNNFLSFEEELLKEYLFLLTRTLGDIKRGKTGSDNMRLLIARMIAMLDKEEQFYQNMEGGVSLCQVNYKK